MFGRKAPIPCYNWLGLPQYDGSQTKWKSSWFQEHHEMKQYVRMRALQKIKADTKRITEHSGAKALLIAKGSLVLLQDHPEGQNKIKDRIFRGQGNSFCKR